MFSILFFISICFAQTQITEGHFYTYQTKNANGEVTRFQKINIGKCDLYKQGVYAKFTAQQNTQGVKTAFRQLFSDSSCTTAVSGDNGKITAIPSENMLTNNQQWKNIQKCLIQMLHVMIKMEPIMELLNIQLLINV